MHPGDIVSLSVGKPPIPLLQESPTNFLVNKGAVDGKLYCWRSAFSSRNPGAAQLFW